jgi:hypothetical protein
MTTEERDLALEIANEEDIDANPYDNYSGRGMFGKETAALTVPSQEDVGALSALAGKKLGRRLHWRIDNLGRRYIAY